MYYVRVAPSLGSLEDTHQNIWGTKDYDIETDIDKPCVFMGLYGLPDFYALWRHKGKKYIFWCGSDITHFVNGYWLDESGEIKVSPKPLAEWINRNCESWVENEVEARALRVLGIESKVCPSFLGNVNQPVTYKHSENPKVYVSVSGDNFDLYGWPLIEEIADKTPRVTYYLYGNKTEWRTKHPNVIVRGRVPKEVMNEEIMNMQCGLRLTKEMDGFSEITTKSILWGQYPIVYKAFAYPYLDSFSTNEELIELLNGLSHEMFPNEDVRNYYKLRLNCYPWLSK
jgi:hypothetical protein